MEEVNGNTPNRRSVNDEKNALLGGSTSDSGKKKYGRFLISNVIWEKKNS